MTPNNTSNTPPPPIPGGWMQTPTGWIPSDTATNYGALIGLPGAKPYDTSVSPPSSTIDANAVATGQTAPSVQFPSNVPTSGSAANNANTTNTSVPSTIPQVTDITGQESKQTPGETTNMDLLAQKANAIGGQSSLATYQTNQESGAGVPGMQKTINDLNTKLQGLTDQSTALQLDAAPGGTIQNKEQLANAGYGVTAAAMSVGNAADLRKNQIQQASIAAQALTLKSAIYAAQGNLSLAKDAADKAAQVQFDAETQKINYINALIDQNKPQMTKEEQAQADMVKAQLVDRTNQIQVQQESFKTGQAAIATAMANNPNNPQAQYAAQQAMALDPKDPNYLTKVQGLISKYSTDLAAKALDTQLKKAQIASSYAQVEIAKQGKQNQLEQDYRASLDKVVSARSGGLGLQDQKVDQAVHLASLMNQFKDANGNFNIPKAQYAELAIGLANLISPSGTVSEGTINSIQQATAQGDLGKAYTYITGQPVNGTSQDIAKLMAESIDRQAGVASNLRDGYMKFLSDSAPTGLDPARKQQINQAELNQYTPIISQNNTTKSGKSFDYAKAKADGHSDAEIQAYLASH